MQKIGDGERGDIRLLVCSLLHGAKLSLTIDFEQAVQKSVSKFNFRIPDLIQY